MESITFIKYILNKIEGVISKFQRSGMPIEMN